MAANTMIDLNAASPPSPSFPSLIMSEIQAQVQQAAWNTLATTSTTSSSSSYDGLTDDGDFAMIGINVHPDDDDGNGDNKEIKKPVINSNEIPPSTTMNEMLLPTSTSSITTSTTTTSSSNRRKELLKQYIQKIFSTQPSSTIQEYTIQLDNIGFDPNCKSRFELRLDDLDFMKVLHARFFYQEVMKEK
uniref:Uncharacterized protein n=1 Tax=Ditylum brightwellii TaxID=49249 RepID=A0A7S4VX95_9STRA